jgi:L-aspartate oxidase
METTESFDVVIAGCGVAGLYTALHLPATARVLMLSKGPIDHCDSMLAQGGICVLPEPGDYDAFFEDTMRAGHYENRPSSVDIMIRGSRAVIAELVRRGVRFARTPDGALAFTREGAHSRPRICYHDDVTGQEITTHLLAAVRALSNVRIWEDAPLEDIVVEGGRCTGAVVARGGRRVRVAARDVVLATGGIGGLYEHSTNYPELIGDGCRIAAAHGAALEHMDYVQIHPTSLYTGKPGRAFLISESARGEGAVLIDAHGERFTDELQPRDVVSKAIYAQMKKDGAAYVRLSFASVPHEVILGHFAHIRARCLEEGYDIAREPIPVVPAQHYFMGGVRVDGDSRTSIPHLYAVGETSCNGVHGKNRLASNSLLESLVFAARAARAIQGRANEPARVAPESTYAQEEARRAAAAGKEGAWTLQR